MIRRNSLACILVLSAAAAACESDDTHGGPDGGPGMDAGTGGSMDGGGGGKGGKGGASGASGSSGAAGAAGAGGHATDAGGPVTFSGTVVVAVQGSLGKEAPLAGVSVCVLDKSGTKTSAPCTTTDAKGAFSLSLAPSEQLIVEFEKSGYGTQIAAVDVGTADAMRSDLRMGPLAGDAGADGGYTQTYGWDPSVSLEASKGSVNLVAITPSASADAGTAGAGLDFTSGVTFTVTPKSGVGPFYVNPDETWASTATSTAGGYGAWYLNLAPGSYSAKAASPTLSCVAVGGNGYGWPKAGDTSTATFPILAGANTQSIVFYCVAAAKDAGHD